MEYFESILENIAAFDEMDVYGHIDYVVRYGPNQNRQYSYGRYKEILDEILGSRRFKPFIAKRLSPTSAVKLPCGKSRFKPCSVSFSAV